MNLTVYLQNIVLKIKSTCIGCTGIGIWIFFHNFKIYSNESIKIIYESILKLFNTWFSLFFSVNGIPVLNFKIHIQVFKSSFQIRTTLHIHLFLFVQSSLLLFQSQFEMTQYIYCYIARLQSPVLNNINNFYQTLSDRTYNI